MQSEQAEIAEVSLLLLAPGRLTPTEVQMGLKSHAHCLRNYANLQDSRSFRATDEMASN